MKKWKGEWIKACRLPIIYKSSIFILVMNICLYCWLAILSGEDIRQATLESPVHAGYFSLGVFVSMFRKIWATIVGTFLVGAELESGSQMYSVQNQGKYALYGYKILVAGVLSAIMLVLSFGLSYFVGVLYSGGVEGLQIDILAQQIITSWFMTMGIILLAMVITTLTKKTIPIIMVVIIFDFFGSFLPEICNRLWEKVDGFWYYSNLLNPIQSQLKGMNNFSFWITENFQGYQGLFLWGVIQICIVGIMIAFLKRKEY